MNIYNHFSHLVTVFHGRTTPEEGYLAGYAAIIKTFDLQVVLPDTLALISKKHKQYKTNEWLVFTPRYMPEDTLSGHLTFALKYEGIDLAILKALFQNSEDEDIKKLVANEPTGQYSRKIWFLYEWLLDKVLALPDLSSGNYVNLVDSGIQYCSFEFETSKRHRIRNNLPGVKEFCPMIRKTEKIEQYIELDLSNRIKNVLGKIHPDVMARTAAFLLLKDSKASYAIEGESPPQNRAQRWGRAIGQAGQKQITTEEFARLQQIVIDNPRFTKMGIREEEGFIGEHDRRSGTPMPVHISAKWTDLDKLLYGITAINKKLEQDTKFDAVLAATLIAFGFVFIHPFVDGNGRIHRYLIHDVLIRKGYVSKGVIFPVSAIILDRIEQYQKVLEHFSAPRLDLTDWKVAEDNNIEVLNETIDLYRYFDATKLVEFLYSCVQYTIDHTIPNEVEYLEKYDLMKGYLENVFEMPEKTIALLVRFLEQGNGHLSRRAQTQEFKELLENEVVAIEKKYQEIFK